MARKSLNGQLNLFDFFGQEPAGHRDVEMVAISPQRKPLPQKEKNRNESKPKVVKNARIESQPQVVEMPRDKRNGKVPVMSKVYQDKNSKKCIYIAYLDYYLVYIQEGEMPPYAYQFEDSKSAVDFYVQYINGLENDKNYKDLEQTVEVKDYVLKELKQVRV